MNLEVIIADGAFASDDTRNTCHKNEVTLVTSAIRGKQQADDVLDSLSFVYDDTGLVLECPSGLRPRSQHKDENGTITANFDPIKCNVCSQKTKCISYISETQSRIVIDYHRRWLDERRELLKTEGYKNLCRMRPAVEGLMEKMKPKHLKGRTKFRGMVRVGNRMLLRAIGLNFRRYMVWFSHYFLRSVFPGINFEWKIVF